MFPTKPGWTVRPSTEGIAGLTTGGLQKSKFSFAEFDREKVKKISKYAGKDAAFMPLDAFAKALKTQG